MIYVDIDTVWLKNPLPYMDAEKYDMLLQVDNKSYAGVQPYYCTGLMAIVANERTVKMIELWEKKLLAKPQLNQPIFNDLLHKHPAVTPAVKHTGLPSPLFPGGRDYFDIFSEDQRNEVVAVHNNYIIGHDKKKRQFKEYGLWLADS